MKLLTSGISCMLLITSCQSTQKIPDHSTDSLPTIAATIDSLGCNKSAGLTWSVLKKKCIQPWAEGIRLHTVNTSGQRAAYVLIDSTQNSAEIFLLSEQNSLLLPAEQGQRYSNGNFILIKEDNYWTLRLKNSILYTERRM